MTVCSQCGADFAELKLLTAADVWRLVEEAESASGWSTGVEYLWSREPRAFYVPGLGTVHVVEATGGEGKGDSCSVVFNVVGDTRLWMATGSYNSYDDNEWYEDDFFQVTSTQEYVTSYRKV